MTTCSFLESAWPGGGIATPALEEMQDTIQSGSGNLLPFFLAGFYAVNAGVRNKSRTKGLAVFLYCKKWETTKDFWSTDTDILTWILILAWSCPRTSRQLTRYLSTAN